MSKKTTWIRGKKGRDPFLRILPMKRALLSIATLSLWLHVSCDFQNPANFEVPTWNINLTIPLLHEKYPLSDIVNDSTIHAAGDSIFVAFDGVLPSDSINSDFLKIPLSINIESSTRVTPPDISTSFEGATISATVSVPIGKVMSGSIINVADPPNMVTIPSTSEQKILGSSWNLIAGLVESTLGDTSIVIPLLDMDELFGAIPFVESVQGVVIGAPESDNTFQSSVENTDLPVAIDTTWATLVSGSETVALHDTTSLDSGEVFDKTTSLVGKTIGEAIEVSYGFNLERAADGDTITIPANTNVEMEMQVTMKISNPEKAIVIVKEYSLAPDLDPISFSQADVGEEDCAINGVYGGVFESPTSSASNKIGISDVRSTFPFDIDFGIKFGNFVSAENDTLRFDATLSRGASPVSKTWKLDGGSFVNPKDSNQALEELAIDLTAKTVSDTVEIFLDGTEPDWAFSMGVEVLPLHFASLEADLGCPFPTQTQEIEGIPQGFTGMSFGEVILKFTMFNQIRLPIVLDLDLVGVSSMGDSVEVLIDAVLARPATTTDTARTVIELSSFGTKVKLFDSMSDTAADSSYSVKAGAGTNTIVELLALNPSDLVVDATAGIDGRGSIDVNAAIWGEYELIAPFKVRMEPMTFIPVTSTVMDEMPHETRNQLRSSVKGTSLTTRVINGLPVGGELAILFSDRDLFPLDRTAETLAAMRDSLGWPPTDSLYVVTSCTTLTPSNPDIYIFSTLNDSTECVDGTAYLVRGAAGVPDTVYSFVDTLFKVVLPKPRSLFTAAEGIEGMVKIPGDTTFVSELDSNKIIHLTGLGDHYINTRTFFAGTLDQDPDVVFFSTRDTLEVQSFMTFLINSTGLLEEAKDEIVVVYPNGGETLTVGKAVTVKWRSLGDKISSANVEVFISTLDDPDVGDDSDWSSISGGPIANVDSMTWTPTTPSDHTWLRVCDESGKICDRSGWYFTVTSTLSKMAVSASIESHKKVNVTERPEKITHKSKRK